MTDDLIQGGGGLLVALDGSGLKEGCWGLGLRAGFWIPILAQSILTWTLQLLPVPSSVWPFFESTSSWGWDWLCLFWLVDLLDCSSDQPVDLLEHS